MKACIITTEYRGVFFGYVPDDQELADIMTLHTARNVIYWPSKQGGFMGLARGPEDGARIGAMVETITLTKVTSMMPVSKEAAEKWDRYPVWRG